MGFLLLQLESDKTTVFLDQQRFTSAWARSSFNPRCSTVPCISFKVFPWKFVSSSPRASSPSTRSYLTGTASFIAKFHATVDFGFATVVDFTEGDTFTGVVPFALVEAFSIVPDRINSVFFKCSIDFTGVLAFTGVFALAAVYASIGVIYSKKVGDFTDLLPLAELFFFPCVTALAGVVLSRRGWTVIPAEILNQANILCFGFTAQGGFAVPSPPYCLTPAPSVIPTGKKTDLGRHIFFVIAGSRVLPQIRWRSRTLLHGATGVFVQRRRWARTMREAPKSVGAKVNWVAVLTRRGSWQSVPDCSTPFTAEETYSTRSCSFASLFLSIFFVHEHERTVSHCRLISFASSSCTQYVLR